MPHTLLQFESASSRQGRVLCRILVVACSFIATQVRSTPLADQSILLVRVSDKKEIYKKNEALALSPASVTKLVTAAAALDYFSPNRTFKTGVYQTGSLSNGEIMGDLIVVGDGDPFLVSEKLWPLAADLAALGIKGVRGNLVIDNSLFDDSFRDRSRAYAEKASRNAYDAPISAFSVNFNTFEIAVAPGDRRGDKARVETYPYPLPFLELDNKVMTQDIGGKVQVQRKTMDRANRETSEKLIATGSVGRNDDLTKVYRSVGDPVQASGEILRQFLMDRGIKIQGKIKEGVLASGARRILAIESYPMSKIVAGLNVFSNNYIADMLVKRIGAEFPRDGKALDKGQGNFNNGLSALERFLRIKAGIKGSFTLKNGSGLDTDNRLSAQQITDLLCYMAKSMDLFPEFIASLPASGWTGTLKKRFKEQSNSSEEGELDSTNGKIRAKTGTLTQPISVSSLAGYFMHKQHGLMAFAIIQNGKSGYSQPSLAELRLQQDAMVSEWLK